MLGAERRPIGTEVKFLVRVSEAIEEMPGLETRPAIEPYALLEGGGVRQTARNQQMGDDLRGRHVKAWVARAKALRQAADHLVIRTALGMRRQDRAADLQESVA